ncbi:periplasmic substrate-binding transporter [Vreelandella aquamarina]|jgi:tripartite ATP-independent transporter DctP family solute receptor|uniref:Tripartite ATP-independent transporter solute receptor, DctP family n=1 Tax=Vreelandella aquamarina TaxID=77097 RepID=A0A1N6J9C9_9GAMM|nr:TRAP transporter substrate-binding protein [Halomonas meridiana]HBM45178.1 C4-dicarboxylate ABC transporter substrate-binding protein [Halomonas sp.]SIN64045.1 tripartite ATP-independent transporter solute receptor, DctP family [Halomonas meridiana]SIN73231.1 tripartite ATP-independent transporter solute receptor, DctP family [Halomonas meridiana]SIO40974.1 tripartite ATP-independent transporter solute receptor, DctP family [Halomonas meridiana]GED45753.1 periplasmic substrate-binding trans
METFARSTLALGISLALVSASNAADFADMDPVTLRLAHVVNEQDGFHIAATKFEELVEERTDGKVNIEIFPNASLGDERTLLEGMQIGTVDMGVITNGPVANFVEEMAVFELPFLFPTPEAAYSVLDGPIGQELLDKLADVNLKGLAYAERGFRNLTNSERAVNSPEDLDGLRIRVMENPVYTDTFRELGANAIPMAWTEALTAMQQGTIDGQENPVNVIHSFKLDETQNYMTLSRHTYAPAIFVMGMPAWNQLPEAAQDVIRQAAQEAAEHERQVNADMEAEQLAALREAGMEINDSPDMEAFQAAVAPVYEKYGEQFGDYLPRIQEALQQ